MFSASTPIQVHAHPSSVIREPFLLTSDTILVKAYVVNQYLVLSLIISAQYISTSR